MRAIFISRGFHEGQYYLANNSEQLIKMLFAKRIDLIPGDPLELKYKMNSVRYDYSNVEIACFLADAGGYYMAVNKDTSVDLIEKVQKSLEKILAAGVREQLIEKYMK